MVTARQKHGAAALGGAVALAFALAGCGGNGKDDKASSAPPAAVTTSASPMASADPKAAEKKAVLTAFDAMWAERTKAYAQADAKGTQLEKYATLDALGKIRIDLARMREAGTVVRGGSKQTGAAVTVLDLTAKTPKASVSTCIDLSSRETYDTRKKAVVPLPTNQPRRYVATAGLEKWPGGWIVTTYTPEGAHTC